MTIIQAKTPAQLTPYRDNPSPDEIVPSDNGIPGGVAGVSWRDGVGALVGVTVASLAQGEKADSAVQDIVAGTDMAVDATDPNNPVIAFTGIALTDGNKGDIVVSAAGQTWDFSTNAKNRLAATAADRTVLAAFDGSTYQAIYLLESGREGTFQWDSSDLSAEVTADPYQGIYVPPSGDPTGAGGAWVRSGDGSLQFNWFGPAKDIVTPTDDTPKWNSAAALASSQGRPLIVGMGGYSIHNGLLYSNLEVIFEPGSSFVQPGLVSVPTPAPNVLFGQGVLGSPVVLTANVDDRAMSCTVNSGDTAPFVEGGYALLSDDDYVFPGSSPPSGQNKEIVRITEKTATTLTFSRPVTTAFTTANNAVATPLTPLNNVHVAGPVEILVGDNCAAGIRMFMAVDSTISAGVTVKNARGGGSHVFQCCTNCTMDGVVGLDGQANGTGGTSYGAVVNDSSTFCTVINSYFDNLRENTFTTRARWNRFAGNVASNMVDSGWNTHGAGCSFNVCENNTFLKCSQAAAVSWTGAARGDDDNVVQNNVIVQCTNGVSLSGNSTGPILGLRNTAKGNVIKEATGRGVSVFCNDEFNVSGNEISDSATTGAAGIYAAGPNDNGMICSNRVRSITGANAFGIRVSGSTNVMVSHNLAQDILGSGAIPFYVTTSQTDIRVQLNAIMDTNAVNLTGAAVNTLNTWN